MKGLQDFVIRGEALKLLRNALRAARNAPAESRGEIVAEIRRSFEVSAHHTDRVTIKHILSDGRIRLKMLKELVGLTE